MLLCGLTALTNSTCFQPVAVEELDWAVLSILCVERYHITPSSNVGILLKASVC